VLAALTPAPAGGVGRLGAGAPGRGGVAAADSLSPVTPFSDSDGDGAVTPAGTAGHEKLTTRARSWGKRLFKAGRCRLTLCTPHRKRLEPTA